MGSDPEGPLCELLFFFLSAIFQALDEEQEEVAKDQAEGQTHTHTHTHTCLSFCVFEDPVETV